METSSLSPLTATNSQRKLTRAKQLRHLRGCDVKHLEYFLNSPVRHRDGVADVAEDGDLLRSASAPPPQPLPLPDLSDLFCSVDKFVNRRDKLRLKAKAANGGDAHRFRLPSPTGVVKERDRLVEKSSANARNIIQDSQEKVNAQRRVDARRRTDGQRGVDSHRSVHRAETCSASNVSQRMSADHAQDKFSLDITYRSAPSSANASPMVSPQRLLNADIFSSYHGEPKCWSDPSMPFSLQQTECIKHSLSRDSSPLHNPPVISSIRPRKSTSGPESPRHPKLHIDISSFHNDNNVFMNVHPLPLPPTPVSSAQLSPLPQGSSRPEYLPVKSQWTKGKLIGRGTFGSVYVATNRETGALCALKEVELCPDDSKSSECIRQLEQEIKVLSDLQHPNIVQYYGSEIVDDRFYIYLEYVYPGSINKYVREHCGAMTEAVVRNFTRHICSGLAYLHGRKTIHRDIKGANLLVDLSGVVKLADFGMAKHLTGQAGELSLKGSPYWMAPELMQSVMQKDNSSDLAFAVDIWSLGCTIIEMLTGKPPWSDYEGPAAMFKVLRESPPVPETLSPEGKDFLNCCFRRNPADRPPAYKLLDHPFLRNCQQFDVPSSSSTLDVMYQTDKTRTPRELYNNRLDKVPMSPGRWMTNVKASINETGLLRRVETSDIMLGPRTSPRSILEPLIIQSPQLLSPPPKLMLSAKP